MLSFSIYVKCEHVVVVSLEIPSRLLRCATVYLEMVLGIYNDHRAFKSLGFTDPLTQHHIPDDWNLSV
jgi:hypothetical protein